VSRYTTVIKIKTQKKQPMLRKLNYSFGRDICSRKFYRLQPVIDSSQHSNSGKQILTHLHMERDRD